MVEENDHHACVNAWMERVANGLPPDRMLRAFERAFAALWWRANRTLGDVTLTAIADRVLYTAAERFSFLSSLKLQTSGIQSEELRERAGSLHPDQLAEGIRFILSEFLTVLGNLTAEILSPALHSELSKAAPQDPESNGEDGES
jgi:hypothetical protein